MTEFRPVTSFLPKATRLSSAQFKARLLGNLLLPTPPLSHTPDRTDDSCPPGIQYGLFFVLWYNSLPICHGCACAHLVLQERGRGLLEITTLVSDNYRKTNNPKASIAFQRRRRKSADAAAAKKTAAALARDADRSDPSRSSSGILSRLFSRSPAASRDNSTDGGAVAASVRAPSPLPARPPDPETVAPANDSGTVPVARDARMGAENDGDGGTGDGGTESGAVSDAVVGSLPAAKVNISGNGPDGVSTIGYYSGAPVSAAVEAQSRGEPAVGDTREVESHQRKPSCTQTDPTVVFLKNLKVGWMAAVHRMEIDQGGRGLRSRQQCADSNAL